MPDKTADVMCHDDMDKAAFDAMMDQGLTQAVPNETTAAAIAEGRAIAFDEKIKGFSSISDLKGDLNE